MNRPDALYFRNTNQLNTLEFVPGRSIYHRIPKWVGGILFAQCALGTALWLGLQSVLGQYWLTLALGEQWATLVGGAQYPA